MTQLWHPVKYALQHNRGHFLILAIIALVATCLVVFTDESKWWGRLLDPIIGVGTFIFAIAVWYGELSQDWEHKLPKQLTVRFIYRGKLLMICKNAALVNEADIRQWGQQIGKQMNRGSDLKFEAFFEIGQGQPIVDRRGLHFKPYFLEYYLSDFPSQIKGINIKYGKGEYLHWEQRQGGTKNAQWLPHPATLPPIDKNDDL